MITWPEMETFIKEKQTEIPELAQYSPLAIFTKAREGVEWRDIIKYTGLNREKVRNMYLYVGYKIPSDIIPELPDDGLKIKSMWLGLDKKSGVVYAKPERKKREFGGRVDKGQPEKVILEALNGSSTLMSANDVIAVSQLPNSTVYVNLGELAKQGKVKRVQVRGRVMWGAV